MHNPFHYGAPACGPNFTGRASEVDAVVSRMRDGVNVVVMSPRRYGKTSLLLRAEQELATQVPEAAVVATNVFLCRDLSTLGSRLLSGLYRVPGARWHRARQGVVDFLQKVRVRPALEFDDQGHPRFTFSPGLQPDDADAVISDVFAMLAAEAQAHPAVLVLDEFQSITRHGEHLPFLLKGLSDSYPGVSLVLAGSQRHLMERLVIAHGAPLYGMAQRIVLGAIPDDAMVRFLEDRAATSQRPFAPGVAAKVVRLAGPVPNDIQRLAYEAFSIADVVIDEDRVLAGMEATVEHESGVFAERVARLSPGQVRVLYGLADGRERQLFGAAFARRVGLAGPQSVRRAIDSMAEDETVVLRAGEWVIGDPFLETWLRRAI